MNHKQAIVEYVIGHPGSTSEDLYNAFKKMPKGTISGRLSKCVADGTLTRTGAPGSFRYYDPNKPQLPLDVAPVVTRKRRARRHTNGAGVLLSIAVGKNHTETMTIDEARAVWKQLSAIFGAS